MGRYGEGMVRAHRGMESMSAEETMCKQDSLQLLGVGTNVPALRSFNKRYYPRKPQ
jgi:hypothetical protein